MPASNTIPPATPNQAVARVLLQSQARVAFVAVAPLRFEIVVPVPAAPNVLAEPVVAPTALVALVPFANILPMVGGRRAGYKTPAVAVRDRETGKVKAKP